MNNLTGLAVSYVFVAGVIAAASLAKQHLHLSARVTRKLIHIGVSHWWLILMAFFDSLLFAVIGPVSFIIINGLSLKFSLVPAMDAEQPSDQLGTIYFPVSLLVLVICSFLGFIPIYAGAFGVLAMGYGDGLASLLGERWGRRKLLGGKKTVVGTVTMAAASAAVALAVTAEFHPGGRELSLLLVLVPAAAGTAAALELLTPRGLDNITVPVASAGVYALLLQVL